MEIKSRSYRPSQDNFPKTRQFLTNHKLNFNLRYRMIKCYIWSVLLYEMKAWILKVTLINKLEAFKIWTLRRSLRISWVERTSNKNVIRRVGLEDRELFKHFKGRKIADFEHLLREERYNFLQLILESKIEGRRIGRKKLWLWNIRY
ncbi:uncharacterized protein LOC113004855 [Solenopsis invicta]|uniref:uncharacterized protein LOC113004855 n=1 Tax=Solenopsis invicta TaxID=13686 RepID=UPI000E34019D|nr:uncharacterized protein LOC113004855 [Solenopsis invicta]XP_025995185.1 uncharacterized protein LOC113004855 [Solenopsis invicta]